MVRLARGGDGVQDASGVGDHLGYLPSDDVGEGQEAWDSRPTVRRVVVPRHDVPTCQAPDVLVERVGRGHICELDGASRVRRYGWYTRPCRAGWHGCVGAGGG